MLAVSEHLDAPSLERAPRRAARRRERAPRPVASISPALALLPLRLFLGVTFAYAGIQKLSDPGFLQPGAPTYIGTQLTGFANHTPGGFILRTFAIPHAELAGVGVAIVEILIGLLAVFGLYTRLAAACGMGLNFLLFLTASWHTSPYFLGPDIVFTFAWLPLVLAGAEGQPALDNVIQRPPEALVRRTTLRAAGNGSGGAEPALTRRTLLAELAGGALALAGISALLKGSYRGPILTGGTKRTAAATGSGQQAAAQGGTGATQSAGGGLPASAVKLGRSNQLPAGQAAEYQDPSDGSPDILIRESDGGLKAFSAVCTHAGCTVGYQGGEIVCPCHGGVYSAQTGEVVS